MHMSNKERICEVKELKIRCTNHREGCGWVGELGGLKSHLDKGCGYVEITCKNEGCGERMSRKNFQTHLQEECDSLACPNRCGVTGIRRRAMPDHHSSCPLEPLDCPFKDAGCTEKIARKDMEDHMTANQQKHIVQGYLSLQQSNEQQKQELNATRQELQATKQMLNTTKQELQTTKEELTTTKQELQATKEEFTTTKQELQATKEELNTTKQEHLATKEELNTTKHEFQATKEELQATKQELHYTKLELRQAAFGLNSVGDTLMFPVTNFPQLEGKVWRSLPFTIDGMVRAHLELYPRGEGRGSGSHVSVSLILTEALIREVNMWLRYNVSVATIGQNGSSTHKAVLELCRYRPGFYFKDTGVMEPRTKCSAYEQYFNRSPALRSELFLKIEEANSILVHETLILELKLLQHHCH